MRIQEASVKEIKKGDLETCVRRQQQSYYGRYISTLVLHNMIVLTLHMYFNNV